MKTGVPEDTFKPKEIVKEKTVEDVADEERRGKDCGFGENKSRK
jgi:hypothetical protein